MATLIGDVFTDSSRFHGIAPGPGLQRQHSAHTPQGHHNDDPHYRSTSRSRTRDAPATHTTPTNTARHASVRTDREASAHQKPISTTPLRRQSGAARIPSPPSSSSSEASSTVIRPQHGADNTYMDPSAPESAQLASSAVSASTASSVSTATTVISAQPAARHQIPSPASDRGPRWNNSLDNLAMPAGPARDEQEVVHVRDLAHIESLARSELANTASVSLNDPPLQAKKYDISRMPINDVIEMVAALLTKITTTNDLQHDALNRNAAHIRQAQAAASRSEEGGPDSAAEHMSPLSSSVLAFHGKNVPAITILSYLSRIHKYCPTTFEVFLSLLVYFDRMTERVNDMVLKAEQARQAQQPPAQPADGDTVMHEDGDETDSDLADDDDDDDDEADGDQPSRQEASAGASASSTPLPIPQATYFVVDSFNIHRLIIAGVTCASKFFSDVFYTNSRYAKVGGLPLAELNHLELQFLLLNDFRLAVPVEDLEAYATMLVEFYMRDVVVQRSRPAAAGE